MVVEDGLVSARKLGTYLNRRGISHVYSSPFIRCLQTAQSASEVIDHIYDIVPEPGLAEFLHEILYPEAYEDETIWAPSNMAKTLCDYLDDNAWAIANPTHPETIRQFHERCAATVKEIATRCAGTTTLLVTHASVIEVCVKTLVPGAKVPEIPFGSITEVVCEHGGGGWRLEALADRAYMETEKDVIDIVY